MISKAFTKNKDDFGQLSKNLLGAYKRHKKISKSRIREMERLAVIQDKISESEEELLQVNDEIDTLLAEKISLNAAKVLKFILQNFNLIRSENFTFADIESLFYKSIKHLRSGDESLDDLYYGEVQEDGHMLICPDFEDCKNKDVHGKPGSMIKIKLDIGSAVSVNEPE